MSSARDCLKSMMLMGDLMTNVNLWPHVMLGEMDMDLLPGMFFHAHGRDPVSDEEMLADETANRVLTNLKLYIRNTVQGVVNDEARRLEREQRLEAERIAIQAKERFRAMSKPAPEGTVRELAEKYGVSIGQVRKLKAENRLHELREPA
jgi:hypothetical protein